MEQRRTDSYPQTLNTLVPRSYPARFILLAAVYGVVFWLSLYLVPRGGSGASLVWPPAALGMAIIFFWGYEFWPALVFPILIVTLLRGVEPPLAVSTAVGNTVEALLVVYVLKYFNFRPMLSRLRDTLTLLCASFAMTMVSATLISGGVYIFRGYAALNTALWVGLWIGHTVSLISFGPFFLRWLYRPLFTKTSEEVIEGVALFGGIAVINWLLFWTPHSSIGGISLVYILIIPLIWAALRTGPRGTSLALFLMALIGSAGILFGYGPISYTSNLSQALFGVQMIIGTLSMIFLLFASITEERKDAVLDLQDHVDKLQGAVQKISSEDQAKADFIAILAHELRNPLSPILSGLEILKSRGQDDEVIRMMGAHLHTTARLLDDLLDISRVSQKKFKLQKEPVELRTIVSSTLEMVTHYFETRRHELTVALPEQELWLHGDAVRLSQVFVNLLNNAAKYTDEGGSISFEARREGEELVVTVSDNGVGIARERLATIFEPFGGGEGNRHSKGGLRIGLSLAKRMVEMHHGKITAESEGDGKGSRFEVRLPLGGGAPLPFEKPVTATNRSRFSREKVAKEAARVGAVTILLVDDNRAAADSLATLLRHNGHHTTVAYDGLSALEMLEREKPDIALLDIGLPDIDGYELARRMRAKVGNKLPLVALTGYGQTEDKRKALQAGFDEHLIKPVSIVDLEHILAELKR